MAPLRIATTIMAKYIAGTIGIMPKIVVTYIESKPVIPVAMVKSRINLFDLMHFSLLTLKK